MPIVMLLPAEIAYDSASALSAGRRDTQEDAVATDFPLGTDFGLAVLADGMGGHAAGDVASKIVVTEVFSDLKLRGRNLLEDAPTALRAASDGANSCLAAHVSGQPTTHGMGSTLIALIFHHDRMHWISVGDSPLWLWRSGKLVRLNEDHSLAPQIDWMVEQGQMEAEVGRSHPDRNCLTSCLMGRPIPRVDCPAEPLTLRLGDLVLMASDGLEFLGEDLIARLLTQHRGAPSSEIARAFLGAIAALDDPEQDNVSLAVIRPVTAPLAVAAQALARADGTHPVARGRSAFAAVTRLLRRTGTDAGGAS
jgi:PPM family protein phosphatase